MTGSISVKVQRNSNDSGWFIRLSNVEPLGRVIWQRWRFIPDRAWLDRRPVETRMQSAIDKEIKVLERKMGWDGSTSDMQDKVDKYVRKMYNQG